MKRKIYIASLLALTACSADDVVDSSTTDPNEITFDVTANTVSRASELHSSSALPSTAKVWAIVNNPDDRFDASYNKTIKYINGETITRYADEGATEANYRMSNKYYWPDDKYNYNLDFYALHGLPSNSATTDPSIAYNETTDGDQTSSSTSLNIEKVQLEQNARNNDDMLYAVAENQTRTTNDGGKVPINFRHALAQLKFNFQNKSRYLVIEINKITVQNIYTESPFEISSIGTSSQFINSSGNAFSDYYTVCSWTDIPDRALEPTIENWNHDYGTGSTYWQVNDSESAYLTCEPATLQSSATSKPASRSNNIVASTLDLDKFDVNNEILVIPQPFIEGNWTTFELPDDKDEMDYDDYEEYLKELEEENAKNGGAAAPRRAMTLYDGDHWYYTYFKISCRIYNIINLTDYDTAKAAADFDLHAWLTNADGTDVNPVHASMIFGTPTTFEDMYITSPSINKLQIHHEIFGDVYVYGWLAGNKYNYTFIFGDDESKGIGSDSNGGTILAPVNISLYVDEWSTKGNSIEIKP